MTMWGVIGLSVFHDAIQFAMNAHDGQVRKGTSLPYIVHPIEVATIVGWYTTDEEVLAAAVLHDTMEDAGVSKDELAKRFGDRVANLVSDQSENKRRDVPASDSWKIRKRETIKEMSKACRDSKLICLGDKLSNLRQMAKDFDEVGDKLWDRFNQKDVSQIGWYYGSIYRVVYDDFRDTWAIEEYEKLWNKLFN